MKTLLVFSWTHLWSMRKGAGAPSYHHTITHYIESADWDVYLFTADATNLDLSIAQEGKVRLYKVSDKIEKGLAYPKINMICKYLKHNRYIKWAEKEADQVINRKDDFYVYGYEIWGVAAAKKIADKYNFPLITRFQGTVLCGEKDTLKNKIKRYPHYEALQTPADLVVMTDDGTFGDEVLKRIGNNSKCLFIRNGLDLFDRYKEIMRNTDVSEVKKELDIKHSERVLLMSSRLTSWKRVERGIAALKEVLAVRNDVKLVIAGDGDAKEFLENYANKLEVTEHVLFLGSVLQNRLYRYMLASDIFMSLYDIGNLGNPTFEAMLMRRPIIALNNGATGTVLHNNENCMLLEVEEIYKLPETINYLLDHEEKRQEIANRAFQFAVQNFYSWDERMKREEAAINEIKKEKRD